MPHPVTLRPEPIGKGRQGSAMQYQLLPVHPQGPADIPAKEQRILQQQNLTPRFNRWMGMKKLMRKNEREFHG